MNCSHISYRVRRAHADAVHARGGAGDCEARRSHLLNFVRIDQTRRRTWLQSAGSNPTPAFIRTKADTGPEGGIPQIAPAEHALVSGIGALFCSGTDARPHTVTCVRCSDRGYCVRRTKPLLPRSHRHNNSAGAAAHSAPNQEATASNVSAAAPKRTRPLRTPPPPRPW